MQIKIIGIGVPRKLTVPITLVPIMELMVSIPLMIGLPAIEVSIPHTDGNGILIMVWGGLQSGPLPYSILKYSYKNTY